MRTDRVSHGNVSSVSLVIFPSEPILVLILLELHKEDRINVNNDNECGLNTTTVADNNESAFNYRRKLFFLENLYP